MERAGAQGARGPVGDDDQLGAPPVASLSGGQRQSVAVAKAVLWNSKLVILDEPTAALGVAQTRQVLDLVRRLADQGLAVVLDLPQHERRVRGRRPHHRAAARADRRRVQEERDHPARGRRGDHRRQAAPTSPACRRRWSHEHRTPPHRPRTDGPAARAPRRRHLGARGAASASACAPCARASSARCRSSSGSSSSRSTSSRGTRNFLTAGNFVNLLAQMAAVTIIGMGIVFVLLLGEIDLSVGYVSGMGGVVAALLLEPGKGVPDERRDHPRARRRRGDRPAPGLLRGQARRAVVRRHARRVCSAGTASCCRSSAARARS